ncbi:MAG TPA: S1C family serine protease [Candidatus Moranbacteria bacterium]|nr:S1C family serine protease [Candidatus Moranbacteria bacterium]
MLKKILFIVGIVIIGGLSGIIFDRYLFPHLATSRLFSKNEFFKKASENVTVINKTEQVYINEDSSINKITNQIVPAVVNIVSYPKETLKNSLPKKIVVSTNSTGEIVTSDGIIMTYLGAPVDFERIYKVITSNGNVYDANLLGVDSWSNLALLKINASNLPVVSFGNSNEYNLGEKLIAISNNSPEYQNKFAAGLLRSFDSSYNISGEALSRAEKIEGVFMADFNMENMSAGGPIVDYAGQVLGITGSTIKNGKIEYFQIPANKAKMVLDKEINNALDSNISLGIYYLPINKTLALANDLSVEHGALIYSASGQQGLSVISGSPADKAGMKINDIITKVFEEEINLKNNLSDILYKYKKGDKVEFTVLRSKDEIKIEVQL